MRFEPLALVRPAQQFAAQFAAPPYDVFDRAEARQFVMQHPHSFLEIDRAEVHFPEDYDMYAPEVYEQAGTQLNKKIKDKTLVADSQAAYYIYRQTTPSHTQVGLVGGFPADAYETEVKRHENIHPDKLQDRIQHILACSAQTGPMYLTCRDLSHKLSDALYRMCSNASPLYDFMALDGVHTSVWRISRAQDEAELKQILAKESAAYIADGHHRCAAAIEVANQLAQTSGKNLSDIGVLSVLFPAHELSCLPYNRVVSDLAGYSPESFIEALVAQNIEVQPSAEPVEPHERNYFGMYMAGKWYRLHIAAASSKEERRAASSAPHDPVATLDTQLLQDHILQPLLNIDDPTCSSRIRFVGGVRGLAELEKRAGNSGVAFSLYATSIDQLMDVADANKLMPPKSTWFEPKLLSGLFIHKLS